MDIAKRRGERIIGIAGGIGSGKSTVTDHLRKLGFDVYDADEIAKEAVMPGELALKELTDFFGVEILQENGTLNRRVLARMAFADEEKTRALNKILHNDISLRIDEQLNENNNKSSPVFISAPLFFEAGLEKKCDETWAIVGDEKLRIDRAVERDNIPRFEIEDRFDRQMTDNERERLASHVIRNDGSIEELLEKIDKLLKSEVQDE